MVSTIKGINHTNSCVRSPKSNFGDFGERLFESAPSWKLDLEDLTPIFPFRISVKDRFMVGSEFTF
jgi:hypothetical protein